MHARAHSSRYSLGDGALAPWQEETIEGRARVVEWLRSPAGKHAQHSRRLPRPVPPRCHASCTKGLTCSAVCPCGAAAAGLEQGFSSQDGGERTGSPASVAAAILEGRNLYELVAAPITLG